MRILRSPSVRTRHSFLTRDRNRLDLACEALESRQLLSTVTAVTDLSQIKAQPNIQMTPLVSSGPTGLSPQQVTSAYGVNQIKFSGGTVSGDGSGQTIAIVTAYHDPNISSDLASFDSYYNIANPPSLTVKNLGGSTTDAGWSLETSLDVEWSHAIAPGAKILLVEAASANLSDLLNAVNYAKSQAGVSVVSMSWGGSEFWGESSYDSTFTTPSGHSGVTFVAASGDSGAWYGPSYPAVSPNVLAVGGTSLSLTSGNTYSSETGWSGSTGGFSGYDMYWWYYESAPSYQVAAQQAVGLNYGVRTTPDVSFNADPNSGVAVFDSVSYYGQSGWFQLGGTSAAAPAWAGLIAITDQGLATGGKGPLSNTQAQAGLYSLPSSDFHDVVSGSNGYSAGAGYDLVTGLGSPRANLLIPGLLSHYGVSITAAAQVITSTTNGAAAVSGTHLVLTVSSGTGSTGNVASSAHLGVLRRSIDQPGRRQPPGASAHHPGSIDSGVVAARGPDSHGHAGPRPGPGDLGPGPGPAAAVHAARGTSAGDPGPGAGPARRYRRIRPARGARGRAGTGAGPAAEPEPAPVTPPMPTPVEPAADPTLDDFDLALEAVSWGLAARRLEFPPAPLNDTDRPQEDGPTWSMSALAGTAVVAAGGYRLLLGRSDRFRRRRLPLRFS